MVWARDGTAESKASREMNRKVGAVMSFEFSLRTVLETSIYGNKGAVEKTGILMGLERGCGYSGGLVGREDLAWSLGVASSGTRRMPWRERKFVCISKLDVS